MNEKDSTWIEQFVRKRYNIALKNTLIAGFILMIVWEIPTHFIPAGWGMAVLNIVFFLLSLWIFWWPFHSFLKLTLPSWLTWLVSPLVWAFIFIALRSVLSWLIDLLVIGQ